MRNLLILAAAASLAVGCHNRSEDETGAAPDRGATPQTASDTSKAAPTDSTMGQTPAATDTTAVLTDTTGAGATPDSALTKESAPSAGAYDSTSTATPADTTAVPADTTAKQ